MYNNFLNSTMYGMARDGPEKENEKKKSIKKQIREALDQNPKFKAFLKQNHVEGRYIKNITNRILEGIDVNERLKKRLDTISNIHKTNIINMSFTWSCTPEGHTFWYNLDRKYSREINSNY